MNDREKLIEIIGLTEYGNGALVGKNFQRGFIGKIADHLIANGVTVQKWIPVSERLPKKFVTVLVQMPLEEPCPTVTWGFLTDSGLWHANFFDREKDEVTHWMPLPQPPKGE